MKNALSVDVDDLAGCLEESGRKLYKPHFSVAEEFERCLAFFEELNISATLFIPGNYFRCGGSLELLETAVRQGHEIGCHGQFHSPVYNFTKDEFLDDVMSSKEMLEDRLSIEVSIYRAPMWSFSNKTPWALECLVRAGYKIDSSCMPNFKKCLGIKTWQNRPFRWKGSLLCIPPTTHQLAGFSLPINGGFYGAYMPRRIEHYLFKKLNSVGTPMNYFFHPYEIFPSEKNKKLVKFKSVYASLYGLHCGVYEQKIRSLAENFTFASITDTFSHWVENEQAH